MGKRRQKLESDSDDESRSESTVTIRSKFSELNIGNSKVGGDDEDLGQDKLSESLDNLLEKRGETREKALQQLIDELMKYNFEWVTSHRETLSEYIKRCTQKGAQNEVVLSLQLLTLVCLTLGQESNSILKEWSESLSTFITKAKYPEHQCSAMAAYSMMCFIADEEGILTRSCLRMCQDLFSSINSMVAVAALTCWRFLLTSIPVSDVAKNYYLNGIESFFQLLDASTEENKGDVHIRTSAGQNIALLTDLCSELDEQHQPPHPYEVETQLSETIEALSKESSKKLSKEEKLKQHTIFRQILSTLEKGEKPKEKIKANGHTIELSSWALLSRLEAFRNALGSGFLHHLTENELLKQVFEVQTDLSSKKKKATGTDKKKILSEFSEEDKERSKVRNKNRKNKNSRGVMEEADDDLCAPWS